jgi:Fur family zinc uptake transcriptional regulator
MQSDGVADTITASASRRGFLARDMTLEVTGTCADCRRSA